MSIYVKDLKILNGVNFQIKEVYPAYRDGWIDLGGKKIHRTFKFFPIVSDDVILGSSDRIKEIKELYKSNPNEKQELREQVWVDGILQFKKVTDKLDKDFFSTWKKVFDIEVITDGGVKATVYSEGKNQEIIGNAFVIKAVSSSKVKSMIRSLVDEEIPMIDGKDRVTGEPTKIEAYDFEDTFKDKLRNKFVKLKVSGTGLDTKYLFLPGKDFYSKEVF